SLPRRHTTPGAPRATNAKAETPPAREKPPPQSRRREIPGVCLLAVGLFAGMSMLSMQLGDHQMMGPGGGAMAAGLYALAGGAGYLLVAGMLLAAGRRLPGRGLRDGPRAGPVAPGVVGGHRVV